MQRIEDHTDPFATMSSSGETRHKLESHPKTYQDFVTKKCALTELLRLFWSAVRDKNRLNAATNSKFRVSYRLRFCDREKGNIFSSRGAPLIGYVTPTDDLHNNT